MSRYGQEPVFYIYEIDPLSGVRPVAQLIETKDYRTVIRYLNEEGVDFEMTDDGIILKRAFKGSLKRLFENNLSEIIQVLPYSYV